MRPALSVILLTTLIGAGQGWISATAKIASANIDLKKCARLKAGTCEQKLEFVGGWTSSMPLALARLSRPLLIGIPYLPHIRIAL